MDIKQINEIIATQFFGLKPSIDFGTWETHDWHLDSFGEIDELRMQYDNHNGPSCKRCGYSYCVHCQEGADEPCEKEAPIYTTNYGFWKVLDKLKELYIVNIEIDSENVTCILNRVDPNNEDRIVYSFAVEAESVPMAICLSAIKSLEDSIKE